MATKADVFWAQFKVDENNKLFEAARKARAGLQNRRNKMGIGRMIGAVGGGLLGLALAPVTGGASLYAAVGAGLGSRVGSEAGTRGAFGDASIPDIAIGKLNQEKARSMQSEVVQGERDLNRSSNMNMLSDAFSAYTLAGTSFGQGAQRFAKNPVQFTQNMFGQAQAPAAVIPNTMAMPDINLPMKTGRERLLETAMQNKPNYDSLYNQLNVATSRGMAGSPNMVSNIGGNIGTLSTPMNPTVASSTNAYQPYLDNIIPQQTGMNFSNQPIDINQDFFNRFYGGTR